MLRLKARERGETIIEVMLALTILSFVLGISYASASRSLRASQDALERSTASHLTMTMIDVVKTHAERFNDPTYNTTPPWDSATGKALVFPETDDAQFCVDTKLSDYAGATAPGPVGFSSTEAYCKQNIYTTYVTVHHLPGTETYEYTATIEWDSIVSGKKAQVLMRYRWVRIPPSTSSTPGDPSPPGGGGGGGGGDVGNASAGPCGTSGAPACPPSSPGNSNDHLPKRWYYYVTLYNTSNNPGLTVVSCDWDLGDGTHRATSCNPGDQMVKCYDSASSPDPTTSPPYTPSNRKNYTVRLTVTLSNGTTRTSDPYTARLPFEKRSAYMPCSILAPIP